MDALAHAIDLYRRGDLPAAETACRGVLAISNSHAQAVGLLAEIHLSSGRAVDAIPLLLRLTQLRPRDAASHRRLGGALLSLARAGEAVEVLRTAAALEPGSTRAHNNLGQALMQMGEVEAAGACFERALALDPDYAIGHNNLGLARTALGDLNGAEASFRRAAALDPALAIALVNLAAAFEKRGRLPEALQSYDNALVQLPGLFEAWSGRGSVLSALCRFEEALSSFDRALALHHDEAAALAGKASALLSMERADDALDHADTALRVQESAEAHNIKAGALRALNRRAEALLCLDRALALNPAYVEGWCNRGIICHELGDVRSAAAAYRRALEWDPDCLRAHTRLLAATIPSVPASEEEWAHARRNFDAELLRFETWLSSADLSEADAFTVAQQQFFYLSYREESNKTFLARYRGAAAAALAEFEPSFRPPSQIAERSSRRFKLGFVSAHVFDHSVYRALLQGWLHCLDRSRFEVTIFSVGSKRDGCTLAAEASVDHFEAGVRSLADWVGSIRNRELDALIYPEIGMDEITLSLASLRLADRQYAAWGHPETSGLPTIDYYLSGALFEPPDAQDHYTERLVALPNLGVHCQPYEASPVPADFTALGIRGDSPVFVCPGVPFKYRPQDDRVLVEIARRLGRCQFIFFRHEKAEFSNRLQARIFGAFDAAGLDAGQYLVSVPWQPRPAFHGLLRQADVYLDTIGFSGFNTLMQGMEAHLPSVTREGRFLRGRLGSAILRRLGMSELVAADAAGYVEIAVGLAEDPNYRAQVREKIRARESILYADASAIDALTAVLLGS